MNDVSPEIQAARDAELARLKGESGGPQTPGGAVVAADEIQFIDTFNFIGEERSYFPGQERLPEAYRQYVVLRRMTNSIRGQVERETSNKITMKGAGANRDVEVPMDPARDRWARIKHSVVDWFVMERKSDGQWSEVPFTKTVFQNWYQNADPAIIEQIETDIRNLNPWMTQDMTIEALEAERDRIDELIGKRREEEMAKSGL